MLFILNQRKVGQSVRFEISNTQSKIYLWIATKTSEDLIQRPLSDIRETLFQGLMNPIMGPDKTIQPKTFWTLSFIILGGARYRAHRNCSGLFDMASRCNDIHPDFQKIILYFLKTECCDFYGVFRDYFEKNFGDFSQIQEFYEFMQNYELENNELSRV